VTLSHHRAGTGAPLLLLHGVGSFWPMWEPVLPALEAEREVLAVDLPGFGGSPVLAEGEPHPAALARAVAAFLDEQGIGELDVAGNSLGGWVCLELAKLGRARSVCAISPAGFWTRRERAFATASLRAGRAAAARLSEAQLRRIYGSTVLRSLALGQFAARPGRMPAEAGIAAARNLATSPGWDATLAAMSRTHVTGAAAVRVPVTIAWGQKDRLLPPRQAQRARRVLPAARHVTLFGCGHVPTWDDPGLVARTILGSSA